MITKEPMVLVFRPEPSSHTVADPTSTAAINTMGKVANKLSEANIAITEHVLYVK
jgi:hypothetical protein